MTMALGQVVILLSLAETDLGRRRTRKRGEVIEVGRLRYVINLNPITPCSLHLFADGNT